MRKNLELKAAIPNFQEACDRAEKLGAAYVGVILQKDTYFNVKHGRMKLREVVGSSAELIYYDRCDETTSRVSTFDIYRSDHPEKLLEVLNAGLGIRAVVEKERALYKLGEIRIHLDRVKGIGTFVEFEIPIREHAEEATHSMRNLVSAFQIDTGVCFNGSYVDMISFLDSQDKV